MKAPQWPLHWSEATSAPSAPSSAPQLMGTARAPARACWVLWGSRREGREQPQPRQPHGLSDRTQTRRGSCPNSPVVSVVTDLLPDFCGNHGSRAGNTVNKQLGSAKVWGLLCFCCYTRF